MMTMMTMMVDKMLEIATRAHDGQTRKMGEDKGKPYIIHPMRVANKFCKETYPMLHAVALGHDILEDTPVTAEDLLKEGIPEGVVELIKILTHHKDEKYVDYIKRVLTDPDARAVKREDLRDNLQSLDKGSLKDKYELSLFIIDNV